MRVDLHTHTNASDGELAPAALLALQAAEGTALTAFTDHDTLGGYDALEGRSSEAGVRLLSGIELSTQHNGRELHVVGLGFDAGDIALRTAVDAQAGRRDARARAIADRLHALGHPGAWDAVCRYANGASIGRPQFARFLVEAGCVRDSEQAFARYLGTGRPAHCRIEWPSLQEVIGWIRGAGGVAVLAHPLAYALGRARLRTLLGDFRDCGGAAAEVALAGLSPADLATGAREVQRSGLRASAGSDFHLGSQFWRRPSRIPPLPEFLEPVWSEWL